MFRLVTTVSGVGPKLALAVLSGLTVGDLQLAVSQGDAKRLAAVKGIGKKTAARIVVELKDTINPIEALANATAETSREQGAVLRDAMLALAALGFSEDIARAKVQRRIRLDGREAADLHALRIKFLLIVGHHTNRAVAVQVLRDLPQVPALLLKLH